MGNITLNDLGMIRPLSKLRVLPATLSAEGALRLELEEGVPVFRATLAVQNRIEDLIAKQQESGLTNAEDEELDRYADIDDFLSFINRLARNVVIVQAA